MQPGQKYRVPSSPQTYSQPVDNSVGNLLMFWVTTPQGFRPFPESLVDIADGQLAGLSKVETPLWTQPILSTAFVDKLWTTYGFPVRVPSPQSFSQLWKTLWKTSTERRAVDGMAGVFSRLFRKGSHGRLVHPSPSADHSPQRGRQGEHEVRIAVYDSLSTVPRIVDVRGRDCAELLNEIASKAYSFAHEKGGRLPYVAIKEIVENLLHADFQDAVISILPDGNTIRVSDQGPGIIEKEKAFLPGFTTATTEMRKIIRGVGSGLPIVRDSMRAIGGSVSIEDNLKRGCVVTLSSLSKSSETPPEVSEKSSGRERAPASPFPGPHPEVFPGPWKGAGDDGVSFTQTDQEKSLFEKLDEILSERQRKVFRVLAEKGEAGPSTIVKELDMSLSTAYRDLVSLEEYGLVEPADGSGKRRLTSRGMTYLARLAR
ncbi:MAG: ATP-binding protein [Clostridia bacterium]